ncbi:MAG: DsbA family oxidoreductase [Alphaproteobacteria bacterium]
MKIDIISDSVCPWCYIGLKRIQQVRNEMPELGLELRWRPFMLNPDMPPEGMSRKEYMRRKFGTSGTGSDNPAYKAIVEAGEQLGIPFAFGSIEKMPNTLDSHRLVRWAVTAGCHEEIVEILFRKYFVDALDISDPAVLIDAAEEVGMDRELVERLLAGNDDKDLAIREDLDAREIGVTGVPAYLIEGKFIIPGAQDVKDMKLILTRVHKKFTAMQAEGTA